MDRITPTNITSLSPGYYFVFGSNERGSHGAGAASQANKKFGAKWGVPFGISGQTFAIPTKDVQIKTLPLHRINQYVRSFINEAMKHNDKRFYVTAIGCGLAGYDPEDIAPMFKDAIKLENVWLPKEFVKIIECL